MRKRVAVRNLELGMYVDELDRPWFGTPFLFQGFPIRKQQELDLLKQYCDFVYIVNERRGEAKPRKKNPTPPNLAAHRFETGGVNVQPPPVEPTAAAQDHHALVRELKQTKKTYDECHSYIATALNDVRLGKSLDVESGGRLVETLGESILRNESALVFLSQLKQHDDYTVRHSLNVCILSLLLGKHLGLKLDSLHTLGLGALLHDIGKMKLPDQILNKPGKLSADEFALVRQHPEDGCRLLTGKSGISREVLDIVRCHHERIDGTGYPRGLTGNALGLLPMIVAITDVYDAITTNRRYHEGISPHEALRQMYEHEIGSFRLDLLDHFIQCLSIFPVGSIVELDSGEVAVVMSINHHKHLLPVVLLVLDADKRPYLPRKVCNLELMAARETPLRIRKILESHTYGIDVAKILLEENNFNALEMIH